MHEINVLTFGSENFNISLEELKDHLRFKLIFNSKNLSDDLLKNHDVLLIHEDYFKTKNLQKELINKNNGVKILVSYSSLNLPEYFYDKLSLPIKVEDLNSIIENSVAKRNFNKNSSIIIKQYTLNKNEKKLLKDKNYILLTEKEIQLLELLLSQKNSVHKDTILKKVWNYAEDVDTHTVETHIYRLRKKIKSKFSDENFILNSKDGYLL